MNMNPYAMEIVARQKQREIATGIRSPNPLRPSFTHRIRSWFTSESSLKVRRESSPSKIVPYRCRNSNLVFLQLYRGRPSRGNHRRNGRDLSRPGFRN